MQSTGNGTAAHVVEPKYPYIVEKYLDLGRFCRSELISRSTGVTIKAALDEYKNRYAGVYRCIKASRFVGDDLFGTVYDSKVTDKIRKRAKGIIKREIHAAKRGPAAEIKTGRQIKRFLSAVTHKGNIFLDDTVAGLCGRIYELNDTYGLSHFMLSAVKDSATAAGFDVFACYCPLNPENKLDHLIIPELSLGFITVHQNFGVISSPYRRIHLDAYLDADTLKSNKQRLKFMRRTCLSLLDEAVEGLKAAKALHDEIEALYNPSVDFDGLRALAKDLGRDLLSKYHT
jgi:hypothetical protein